MTENLNAVALALIDGPGRSVVELRETVEITEDPQKSLLYVMYDRYKDGVAPPPEPEAERMIVRIAPEKLYHWPPVPPNHDG